MQGMVRSGRNQVLLAGLVSLAGPFAVQASAGRAGAPLPFEASLAEASLVGKIRSVGLVADGRSAIVAVEDASGALTLRRIAVDGTNVTTGTLPIDASGALHDHVVSPDGSRIVYRAGLEDEALGLHAVASDGGAAPVEIVAPSAAGGVERTYAVGPDGRTVAFASHHEDAAFAHLYAASTEGGAPVALSPEHFDVEDFRFHPDGRSLVFRGRRGAEDALEIHVVPIDGLAPSRHLVSGEGIEELEISADGAWVVFLRVGASDGQSELAAVPTDASREPLVLARGVASGFQLDPLGQVVVYVAERGDDPLGLYAARIDGRRPPLEIATEGVGWFAVTADGARVVYLTRGASGSALWQVARARGAPQLQLVASDVLDDAHAFQLSGDGRRLVFLDGSGALHGVALDVRSSPFRIDAGPVDDDLRIDAGGRHVVYVATERDGTLVRQRVRRAAIGSVPSPVVLADASSDGGTIASSAGGVGYRDFSYGITGSSTPTGEKPESKLWFTNGSWWGCLYNDAAQDYHAYRLDASTQTWVDTGSILETRNSWKVDVLWEETSQKLFVATHAYSTNPMPTVGGWGRLGRFSFQAATGTYTLDNGFPVNITRGSAEALTIAKDSHGRLWATWVEAGHVMINHSLDNHANWGAPFVLPTATSTVSNEDISAVVSFGGNKVGVMWSNQSNVSTRFVVHQDADPTNVWQAEEVVLPDVNCGGACSDDHISIKADTQGRVFAVLKTSNTQAAQPLNMVCRRSPTGTWTSAVFGRVSDHHTRAILLLDEENDQVHVFATNPEAGGSIYRKSSSMDTLQFAAGVGTPAIVSPLDTKVNNVTSTKQSLTAQTGLVILASDHLTHFYLHNTFDLGEPSGPTNVLPFHPKQIPERER